jgi:hemoglobin-like flavoprotein
MTPHQIMLVQASLAKAAPIVDVAAGIFYGRLFDIAPEVQRMFKGDIGEQGRKLMATLGTVVKGLGNIETVLPAAKMLAVKHVLYGVKPEHYVLVGDALIWTLEKGLGDDFTPETRQAWLAAYGTLSAAMIEEAYGKAVA